MEPQERRQVETVSSFDMTELQRNELTQIQDLMNEITTWNRLEHYNILPLLGIAHRVHGRTLPSLVSPWCERGSVFEVSLCLQKVLGIL
jgi:hypothetical protein